MRTAILVFSAGVSSGILGSCGPGGDDVVPLPAPDPYAKERVAGLESARRDIAEGKPRLQVFGEPDGTYLNLETGLLERGHGCCVYPEVEAEADAYNREIRRALAVGALDRFLLKHKVFTAGEIARRFAEREAVLLANEGDVAEGPRPGYRARLGRRYPRHASVLALFVEADGKSTGTLLGGRVRVLFEHEGTTLLVQDEHRFWSIDLPSGLPLQAFPRNSRE